MMDHLNITVLDGAMVSTKRGLQVSKSTHQGVRFVNSYAAPDDDKSDPRSSTSSAEHVPRTDTKADNKPGPGRKFKFVYRQRRGTTSRSSPEDDDKEREQQSGAGKKGTQKRKGRRRSSAAATHQSSGSRGALEGTPTLSSSDSMCSSDDSQALIDLLSPSPSSSSNPAVWDSYNFGFPMTGRSRKMVHAYFASIPSKMYPLDHLMTHNPVRTPGFYDRINRDIVILRCVAGTGLFLQTLLKGVRCNDEVLEYMANLYSLINGQLQVAAKVSPATIECICSMAIAATHIGQYDHWRLHMQGLKQITETQPEVMEDEGYLMNKLRRADIKGAAIVGELPYLMHRRVYPNVSNVLPQIVRDRVYGVITSALSRSGVRPSICASISGLAVFALTIKTASAAKKGSMLFAPNAFIDEWYWVQHEILCHPGPICDVSTPAQSLQIGMAETEPSSPSSSASASVFASASPPAGIESIRMPPPQSVAPSYAENLVEPAARIAGILYIEALMPDDPRTLNGYAVLLALATRSTEDVMAQARRRSAGGSWHSSLAAMKPVMIWVALVAYAVAKVGDGELQWGSPRYDRSVYLECLAFFVGVTAEDVERLSEEDLALCKVLEVKALLRRDVSSRDVLKEALAERGEGGQVHGFGDWESGWVW